MRVATFVLGIAFAMTGVSEASDSATTRVQPARGEGVSTAPTTDRFTTPNTSAWLSAQESSLRNGAIGAMGFVPSQNLTSLTRSRLTFGEVPPQSRPYNPANIPLPRARTLEDHLLTGFVALMLIAYQLRRKHRFLRPHQFST